jgi:hypothetical protein
MCVIVCEKSSMLHSDRVNSDILAEKTKLGASMILKSTKAQYICNATTALTNKL